MFRVAKQNRIFQDVVEQIQEAIINGDLRPGDTLPPERDLKDTFRTSRGTLREALRVLEQKGLIEIRLGVRGGAVVKAAMADPFSESLDLLIRSQKVSLSHLAEFREGVEGTVAALATRRATGKDIRMLESLLSEAETHVAVGPNAWDDFVNVDKRFHQALAHISGNPIYILINQMVHENIQRYYDRFLPVDGAMLSENYTDLCKILEIVKSGDAVAAREVAVRHVKRFNDVMESNEQGLAGEPRRIHDGASAPPARSIDPQQMAIDSE
jgi:GntR family transcriptional repressor for pyruvate dehydrogenase complex